ncbi:metallophosphoesterase family protein [candidate division KSB1 bacterium]
MKIALISDVHSNLEALQTCFEYIDSNNDIEKTIFLGDLIGYGADPDNCILLVKEKTDSGIIGNHDCAVIEKTDIEYFNSFALEAVFWTRNNISEESRTFLISLPYTLNDNGTLFVHGTPGNPEIWDYILNWQSASLEFDNFEENICFVGHSHVPGIYSSENKIQHDSGVVELNRDDKYIINVGSVGQPRDGDPKLSFGIFDTDTWTIEIIRLEYDIETAGKKIINAGLPDALCKRLFRGR